MPNPTMRVKREKHSANIRRNAFGSYNRFATPDVNTIASYDRRDGGAARIHAPNDLSELIALAAVADVKVKRLKAGIASGLAKDVGTMGKGQRTHSPYKGEDFSKRIVMGYR